MSLFLPERMGVELDIFPTNNDDGQKYLKSSNMLEVHPAYVHKVVLLHIVLAYEQPLKLLPCDPFFGVSREHELKNVDDAGWAIFGWRKLDLLLLLEIVLDIFALDESLLVNFERKCFVDHFVEDDAQRPDVC